MNHTFLKETLVISISLIILSEYVIFDKLKISKTWIKVILSIIMAAIWIKISLITNEYEFLFK
ncbi:putative membrane protein [Clostridioides difficile CD160]|uniref:hypothetical protein n=1 Tax=unclassified Clostridioides TaxID=2635829 RepID=UPI00038D811F|nr:putative membrane protein [Clostridioides difficile CD160]